MMVIILLVCALLQSLILSAVDVHLLWIAAVVLAVVWVASFALSRGVGASRGTVFGAEQTAKKPIRTGSILWIAAEIPRFYGLSGLPSDQARALPSLLPTEGRPNSWR